MRYKTNEDIAVDIFAYGFTIIYTFITLVPFINVVSKAFSAEWALISGSVTIFPKGFQLGTMKYVLSSSLFAMSFKNSVYVTVCGTALSIVITGLAAYPMSKRNIPMQKSLMLIFVFTMLFSGGMIPTYLQMKDLGLTNTLQVLFLPGAINVYNMLLIKNYYESLPESLEESAKIDGAMNIVILARIVVPVSMPVFATIALFTAVGLWNNYMSAAIFNTQTSLKTLPVYLRDILTISSNDLTSSASSDDLMNIVPEGIRSATIVASTIPILVIYPFLQKYFIKGVMIGSIKG